MFEQDLAIFCWFSFYFFISNRFCALLRFLSLDIVDEKIDVHIDEYYRKPDGLKKKKIKYE